MRVKINQVPEGKKFMLEVEPYYTGLTIKKKIEYFYDISCDDYILTYESVRIKDDKVLSSFDVGDRDTMNLIDPKYAAPETFPIHYKTLAGEAATVFVQPTFTIRDLKQVIFGQTGTPPNQIRLLFGGQQLKDALTISHYNLRKDCSVHIVPVLAGS